MGIAPRLFLTIRPEYGTLLENTPTVKTGCGLRVADQKNTEKLRYYRGRL